MSESRDYEQLIYCPRTYDMDEFEDLVSAAKGAGFTHIYISELSERTDVRGDDRDSPWCEWSSRLPSVFKHVTLPGLEEAYDADFVQRQMAVMKERHEIVARHGLRAAYFGNEPLWLSQRVYDMHPAWRGARCDNSLRTVGMFFAPDVDHPEVRELYRKAVEHIVTECPLLDTFAFVAGDSGSGYPWGERLYVNPNGPTGTQNQDMGVRVVEFLDCLRRGALDGGAAEPRVFVLPGFFTPDEQRLLQHQLKPGVGLWGGVSDPDLAAECALGGIGGDDILWYPTINKFPHFRQVVDAVASIKTSKVMRFHGGGCRQDYFDAFRVAMGLSPATTERQRLDVLHRIAEELFAPDVAEDVLEAWCLLDRAAVMRGTEKGINLTGGPFMLRWLVRPLVPHQELLTDEERAYWEPYIYQSEASQPETYLDYLNVDGTHSLVDSWSQAKHPCIAIDRIEGTLRQAVRKLEEARDKTSDDAAREKLRMDALRVRAFRCVLLTVRHTLQMGALIYEHRKESEKSGSVSPELDLPKGMMGSHGLFYMHRTLRWELDNTYELIDLVRTAPEPLFYYCPDKKDQGPLLMGPDILENLEKKVRIMLKYWRTAESGYYRPTKGG